MVENVRINRTRIGDVAIHLREAGPHRESEAVVFLHGNPSSGEDFYRLVATVGDNRRVLAPDMPGFGKSDRPAGFDYTIGGYAAFLGRLLDDVGVERVHLGLHDLGGPWGLTWAASNPERVKSLMLFNTGIMPEYQWHKFARIWRTPIIGELNMLLMYRPILRMLLNADNPKPFPEDFVNRLYSDIDWPMKRGVLKQYRTAPNPGEMYTRLGAALKYLALPTLVVWGEGDRYVPVHYAEAQKEYFNAEVHTLPEVGHWPMIDAPDEVNRIVLSFLERHAY